VTTASPLSIRCFDAADTDAVFALWLDAFPEYKDASKPQRDPHLSIANKLATQPELFFVAVMDACIVGTVMAGYDGHRGWLFTRSRSIRRNGARGSARGWCGTRKRR